MTRKIIIGFWLALAAVLAGGSPASAHAVLESTNPANNARVDEAPKEVSVRFDDNVEAALGALRVYNSDNVRVDVGNAHHIDGDGRSVGVAIGSLPPGGYVATWRVVSADSHPVHGAFTFTVGNGDNDAQTLAAKLLNAKGGSVSVGVAYAAARTLLIAGLTILIGVLAFRILVMRIERTLLTRIRRLALVTAALGSLGVFVLQGVYAAGLGVGRLGDGALLRGVLDTRLGKASLIRLALITALFVYLEIRSKRPAKRRLIDDAATGLFALALIATLTLSGHGATGRWVWLASVLDVAHVASAAAWVGGLIILVAIWRRLDEQTLPTLVAAFSRMALIAVSVLVATGSVQGYRQSGSIDALTSTGYGQILLVKVALVGLMVFAGWLARKHLSDLSNVMRSLRVEALLSVGVFIATALLMNATPGYETTSKPYAGEVKVGSLLVDAIVTPARTGTNSVHFYTLSSSSGVPTDVPEMTASMTLSDRDLGPIPIQLVRVGSGHFASYAFDAPIKGKWQLDVVVRTSGFDQSSGSLTIPFN